MISRVCNVWDGIEIGSGLIMAVARVVVSDLIVESDVELFGVV